MFVAAGLEPVADAFALQGKADPNHSAQLAIYVGGELVLDATIGDALAPDSLLPIFSSSKGAAAVVIALLVERGLLDLDERVATYWPQFAEAGKGDVRVRTLLSHQAGLTGVDGGYTLDDVLAHDALAQRLAAQRPFWRPGSAFLYHGFTIGTLADELCRRIDGRSIAQVLRDDVTGPYDIDLWIGTPESEDHRFVPYTLPPAEEILAAMAELMNENTADSYGITAMPGGGILPLLARINDADYRRAEAPAICGMSNARGLAKLYAALTHDVGGPRLLNHDTISQMSQLQVQGIELGSGLEARFGVIFQKATPPRWGWGSWQAFGHDGAGGSCAFNDPQYDVAFGYAQQQLTLPGGVDPRALELTRVLRSCLA